MGRPQKHPITLTPEDQTHLQQLISQGHQNARVIRRAHTLLLAHEGRNDKLIAEVLRVDRKSIQRTRERYVQQGLQTALPEGKRPGATPKLDNKQHAMLIALACSDTPDGRDTWSMQMLADRLIELGVVDEISDETVRRTLKKTLSNRGRKSTGVSPE